MVEQSEILVHISTSDDRQRDQQHRALAKAYHEFVPGSSTRYGFKSTHGNVEDVAVSAPRPTVISLAKVVDDSIESKDILGTFPLKISTVGRMLRETSAGAHINSTSSKSILPLPLSRLEQLRRIESQWSARALSSKVGDDALHHQALPSSSATGYIEDTQSACLALESQLEIGVSETSSISDHSWAALSITAPEPSPLVTTTSIVHAQRPAPLGSPSLLLNATGRSQAEVGLKQSSASKRTQTCIDGIPLRSSTDNTLPVLQQSVLPPAPKVTVCSPALPLSHMTPVLANLKEQNPDRFSIHRQHRPVALDERGYWLVCGDMWSHDLQVRFWSTLTDHVSHGRVGWDVTLHRETDDVSKHFFRVYCWSEVVEHVWILLWLCSEGKLLSPNMTSRWMDAADIVVLEVLADNA